MLIVIVFDTGRDVGSLQSEWTGRRRLLFSSSLSKCHLSGMSSFSTPVHTYYV